MNNEKIIELLKSKTVIKENDCWIWIGWKTPKGYGQARIDNRILYIHRISAHIYHGLDLDDQTQCALHKNICSDKCCWNPEHLYVGTDKDNKKDLLDNKSGFAFSDHNRKKTHCPRGHEYSLENTKTKGNKRTCRTCERELQRIRRALK